MKRFIASLTLAAALFAGAIGLASPAVAGSTNNVVKNCDGTEVISAAYSYAWNGFGVAWSYNVVATAVHQSGPSCAGVSQWQDSNVNLLVTDQRQTIGGWVTCGYTPASGVGSAQATFAQPVTSGVCGQASWPAGFQRFTLSATAYHSGTPVTVTNTYYTTTP